MKKSVNYCKISLATAALVLFGATQTVRADSGAASTLGKPTPTSAPSSIAMPAPAPMAAPVADPALATVTHTTSSAAAEEVRVVKASSVNLRARPSNTAEVVTQLKKGEQVTVLETKAVAAAGKSQEWARITLPSSAKCYVLTKLIVNGKATGEAINIRCGPGTNFKEVGKLAKDEKVHVVKTAGEWTQIKPNSNCVGWVAAQFLEAGAGVKAVTPRPAPPVESMPYAPPVSVIVPEPPVSVPHALSTPPAPAVDTLSYYVVKEGVFQTVTADEKKAEKALAPYELMTVMTEDRQYRIAYLETTEKDLDKYEGKNIHVLGTLKWKRGDRYPVIVVDRIDMVW